MAIVGPGHGRWQATFWLALAALPAAWLARTVAFAMPGVVESLYSRGLYPWITRSAGLLSAQIPISLAELLILPLTLGVLVILLFTWRRATGSRLRRAGSLLLAVWGAAGALAWLFLGLWGFHYARPSLAQRLDLDLAGIESGEVLGLGTELGAEARRLRSELRVADDVAPAPLPPHLDFAALDRSLERAFLELGLPGDRLGRSPVPAKPLLSSELFSWLGISGIYVPFTAEPSVNARVPPPTLPTTIAHEKAHQRGVTDEGEANLVGLLAALASDEPYIRYSAHLDASARLIAAASRYLPEDERAAAWGVLVPGPLADLRAVAAYWRAYEGPAREAATRMNDAYLRSNRVPGGVESYDRVTRLLVGAARAGRLPTADG